MIASSANTCTRTRSIYGPKINPRTLTLAQQPPKINDTIRTMLVQVGMVACAAAATKAASFFESSGAAAMGFGVEPSPLEGLMAGLDGANE